MTASLEIGNENKTGFIFKILPSRGNVYKNVIPRVLVEMYESFG